MSHKGGKMCQIETVRLSINEHLTSMGEEILCVLEKQRGVDEGCVKVVRVFVSERLSLAAEFILTVFQREVETLLEMERRNKQLDVTGVDLGSHHNPTEVSCEHEDRQSSLVQEEAQPPQIKEEQEEVDVSTLTSLHRKISCETPSEYNKRYGSNEEGGIVPQMARKDCIMEDKISENTCPICRDPSIIIHAQNVKVLEQFMNPNTGTVYDQAQTGVCHQHQNKLNKALFKARNYGFLPVNIPNVDFTEDYNTHHGVRTTPPPPCLNSDFMHLPVCIEDVPSEQQEWRSSQVQEEPEHPQIKEHEELLQTPEEADGSMLTIVAVKSEDEDDENGEMEPVASTSTEHLKTQAYVQNWVASRPTSDEHLSSHYSESDTEYDTEYDTGDEWDETKEDQSGLETLESHKTQNVGGNTETNNFSCTVCGKMFNRKAHLKRHILAHEGQRPFICTICGKTFHQNANLKTHMIIHTGEKPFSCKVCSKLFYQKSQLKRHLLVHTEEKPFTCTVCSKTFNRKASLKRHTMTHTGEKLFTCTVCGKMLNRKDHLNSHMKIHKGEKPTSCTLCGQGCVHMRHLKLFTCTVCGKIFNRKEHLKTHMMLHTGEKPFTCTVCGHGCVHRGQLNKHMTTKHMTTPTGVESM